MTWPLRVLAVPSVLAGVWGIDSVYARAFGLPALAEAPTWIGRLVAPFSHSPAAALASLAAVAFGAGLAWPLYSRARTNPLPGKLGALARAMRDRFYVDELYGRVVAWTQDALAALANAIDEWVISGILVRGAHGSTEFVGRILRLVQTGNLQTYAFYFAMGVAAVLLYMLRHF